MAWHTARVGKTLNQLGMTPTPSPSIFFALLFVSAACTPSVDAGSGYRGADGFASRWRVWCSEATASQMAPRAGVMRQQLPGMFRNGALDRVVAGRRAVSRGFLFSEGTDQCVSFECLECLHAGPVGGW